MERTMWKIVELSADHQGWKEVAVTHEKAALSGHLSQSSATRIAIPSRLEGLDRDARHSAIREALSLNGGTIVRVLSGAHILKVAGADAGCPNDCYCMVTDRDHYCEVSYCDGSHCWSVRCHAAC